MNIDKTVGKYIKEELLDVNSKIKEDKGFTTHLEKEMKKLLNAEKIEVKFERGYYMGSAMAKMPKNRNIISKWGNKMADIAEKYAFRKDWQIATTEITSQAFGGWDIQFHVGVTDDD